MDDVIFPSEEAIMQARNNLTSADVNVGNEQEWGPGELEFEAEMRVLDQSVNDWR